MLHHFTLMLCVATAIHKQITCQNSGLALAPNLVCRKSCSTLENQRDVVNKDIQRPNFTQTHNFTSKCFTGSHGMTISFTTVSTHTRGNAYPFFKKYSPTAIPTRILPTAECSRHPGYPRTYLSSRNNCSGAGCFSNKLKCCPR